MAASGQKVDSIATNEPSSLFDAQLNMWVFMKLGEEGIPVITEPLAFTIHALTHKIIVFKV